MTETPPPKSPIVFGTDGWRARIAEDFTFENVRRCADGVARYVVGRGRAGEGRRDRLRPALRLGALRDGRRRGHPRPRHPGRVRTRAVPTQMSSYEVLERGAAAGVVITASHIYDPNRSDDKVRIAQYISMMPAEEDNEALREWRVNSWRERNAPEGYAFPAIPAIGKRRDTLLLNYLLGNKLLGLDKW